MNTIYPVILSVPQNKRHLIGRKKVKYLSAYARDAIQLSAKKSKIVFSVITKDENGVPQPFNGSYWSLTHKSEYVGGVVAPAKIGIDIEKIKRCSKALFKRIADEKEWNLIRSRQIDSKKLFFRYWTSKEAVLKALGTGFKDLSRCKIAQVVD
ncbi:MAG: 4'-phosphopantetheinyl transferase superfamily protein, partial [Desulfobacterales bacterium]